MPETGRTMAENLMDGIATELAMSWAGSSEIVAQRQAFLRRAFDHGALDIMKALDLAVEAYSESLRNSRNEGLHIAEIRGLSEAPFRQKETRMPPKNSRSVPVTAGASPRRRRPWIIVVGVISAGALAFGLAGLIQPPSAPARVAHLRYVYTNPGGCKIYRSLDGPSQGSLFGFCPKVKA